jgi:hypothetical protein
VREIKERKISNISEIIKPVAPEPNKIIRSMAASYVS